MTTDKLPNNGGLEPLAPAGIATAVAIPDKDRTVRIQSTAGTFVSGPLGVALIEISRTGTETETRICAPIEVVCRFKNPTGEAGFRIRFLSGDKYFEMNIDARDLTDKHLIANRLLSAGFSFYINPLTRTSVFIDFLNAAQNACPVLRVRVSKLGWGPDFRYFATANEIIVPEEDRSDQYVLFVPFLEALFTKAAGTLESWKATVGTMAQNSPVWLYLICFGLAVPLLEPLGWTECIGALICGASSTGKTSGFRGMDSIFAMRPMTADMTKCGLEVLAAMANGHALAGDELGAADNSFITGFAFPFISGVGRQTMTRDREYRPPYRWSSGLALSNEYTFSAEIELRGAGSVRKGLLVRFPSIKAQASATQGILETVPDGVDPQTITLDYIKASRLNCGNAGPAFIRKVLSEIVESGREVFQNRFETFYAVFLHRVQRLLNLPDTGDGALSTPQKRVLRNFGVVAFAGALATSYGILPGSMGDNLTDCRACTVILKLFVSLVRDEKSELQSRCERILTPDPAQVRNYSSTGSGRHPLNAREIKGKIVASKVMCDDVDLAIFYEREELTKQLRALGISNNAEILKPLLDAGILITNDKAKFTLDSKMRGAHADKTLIPRYQALQSRYVVFSLAAYLDEGYRNAAHRKLLSNLFKQPITRKELEATRQTTTGG